MPAAANLTGSANDAVTAADIAALKLDADLRSVGLQYGGRRWAQRRRSFSGLVRAFFTAGTRGLLASH